MKITVARHYGMCFGVRDALKKAGEIAAQGPATVLGDLVHNPVVQERLREWGLQKGQLDQTGTSGTERVVITAHGASNHQRAAWKEAGFQVTDTTCPLVHKAHHALARLVAAGCFPLVIGQKGHVEVRGLCGDFPMAQVVEEEDDLGLLPRVERFGVVAQTTQPVARVEKLVALLRERFPESTVQFQNTVCQPTRDRQLAMEDLCLGNTVLVVIGGRHSNNTRQLTETGRRAGLRVHQVETEAELREGWFESTDRVGVTAGTSTLEETVQAVVARLREFAAAQAPAPSGELPAGSTGGRGLPGAILSRVSA